MADDKRPQSLDVEPRHRILRLAGYAAAATFCAVSVGANLKYGLSLGRSPIDKATYSAASVAADVFKVAAPLLVLRLRSKHYPVLAIAALLVWLGCFAWSMASAVGFVLSSRGEVIAERVAGAATRHGWEAKVERAETQLATLGSYRPPDVVKAELASVAVPLHIWRRSRQCLDLTLEESRLACAPVLGLRRELAAAEAAERLEAQLLAGRTQLATVSVAGSIADPQASALARIAGTDEATVRTGIALLLAGLIEIASALGFTLVSVATARNPSLPNAPLSPNTPRRPASTQRLPPADTPQRPVQTRLEMHVDSNTRARVTGAGLCRAPDPMGIPPRARRHAPRSGARRDANERPSRSIALERWIRTRLHVDAIGRTPAREAYADFCRWASAQGIEPGTETSFGREFSTRIVNLGGAKVKRRDRAYYDGVILKLSKIDSKMELGGTKFAG